MKDREETLQSLYQTIEQFQDLEPTEEIVNRIEELKEAASKLEKSILDSLTPWDIVQIARKMQRPRARFYIEQIVDDFIELHGDRSFRDDPAIVAGIGKIGEHVVTIIGQNKGTNAKENIACNFGMPHPEGYRKALRLMKQAEKFGRPIVCLIDTPGAYCGIGAEERGQGEAIARNLLEMSRLKVPIIAGVIGEGGSGGALALGVADRVFMQQYAIYAILSPEGFASILWKDSKRAQEAAEKMKITSKELKEYGIIEDIIEEPLGGAHKNPNRAAELLKHYLITQLDNLQKEKIDTLIDQRYQKFRKFDAQLEE